MRTVLYVLAGRGGNSVNFLQLVRGMALAFPDDEIVVVCMVDSHFVQLDEEPNVQVIALPEGRLKEWRRFRLNAWEMKRLVHRLRPDVVWSQNIGPYTPTGVPHVMSIHNAHQVYPWAETRSHPGSRLRRAALRWFFRVSLARSDGAIVQTDLIRDLVARIPGAPRRIAVIPKAVEWTGVSAPDGLPPSLAERLSGSLGPETFTFLYVSTFYPHKNHEILLAAADELRRQEVPVRVALTLSEQEVCRIGGETARRSIDTGHIVPLGWVGSDVLRPLYDACDTCAMPSTMESLSSAHLEAMQWGKAQVCCDLPYAHDLCAEAALYADPHDAHDWCSKMLRVVREPELRRDLVQAGHQRMLAFPPTWEEAGRRVRGFLAEIAGRPEPSTTRHG